MSTHLTPEGHVQMVDVGAKTPTRRVAVARGRVRMNSEALAAVTRGGLAKGDAFAAARIAAIQAAKKTSDIVPLCHPLALEAVEVRLRVAEGGVEVEVETRISGKTGVEMEALTAVAAACLTFYDMAKSLDRAMEIGPLHLVKKSGGRSGTFERTAS